MLQTWKVTLCLQIFSVCFQKIMERRSCLGCYMIKSTVSWNFRGLEQLLSFVNWLFLEACLNEWFFVPPSYIWEKLKESLNILMIFPGWRFVYFVFSFLFVAQESSGLFEICVKGSLFEWPKSSCSTETIYFCMNLREKISACASSLLSRGCKVTVSKLQLTVQLY